MSAETTFDARPVVEGLIRRAVEARASDVHVEPVAEGYELRYRVDGLLETVDRVPRDMGRGIVLRLMVMGQLLTYKLDIPQEGRVRVEVGGRAGVDLRLAVMPVAHGLRAVVRLPAELVQPRTLDELGLPARVLAGLKGFARAETGMLLVTGPAGSGKTTTIYALLEYLAATCAGISILSIEDPVERVLKGVTQVEVSAAGPMTYERALMSLLRQDPQILMMGEIRDAATASVAVQAALSGHRLICTLHAGHPGGAIARLIEMGIAPYQLTSSVYAVVTQRLLRRRADGAYLGRVPVGEIGFVDSHIREAILRRADGEDLRNMFGKQPGYDSMRASAEELIRQGITDAAEVVRVLGG
jgi:general secretion pathway protein E